MFVRLVVAADDVGPGPGVLTDRRPDGETNLRWPRTPMQAGGSGSVSWLGHACVFATAVYLALAAMAKARGVSEKAGLGFRKRLIPGAESSSEL